MHFGFVRSENFVDFYCIKTNNEKDVRETQNECRRELSKEELDLIQKRKEAILK